MRLLEDLGAALERLGRGDCAGAAGLEGSKAQGRSLAGRRASDSLHLHELALEYSWNEVAAATGGFSRDAFLGGGACGTVYRGRLEEGIDVAVKVIEAKVGDGFDEEVVMLSRCRHPNVVMLLGFAQEDPNAAMGLRGLDAGRPSRPPPAARRALVYELLLGSDANSRLRAARPFPWQERLNACIGAARGLAHLHKHRPEVFHRDIKTANVLFGLDGTAKIADFGFACVSRRRAARELAVDAIAGTPGYADPLYARTGVVAEANEVYSLGVVLVELLTGRPPCVVAEDGFSLIWLMEEMRLQEVGAKERVLQLLDPRASWPLPVATSLATLALLCVHPDAARRPSFLELAPMLQDLAGTARQLIAAVADLGRSGSGKSATPQPEPPVPCLELRRDARASWAAPGAGLGPEGLREPTKVNDIAHATAVPRPPACTASAAPYRPEPRRRSAPEPLAGAPAAHAVVVARPAAARSDGCAGPAGAAAAAQAAHARPARPGPLPPASPRASPRPAGRQVRGGTCAGHAVAAAVATARAHGRSAREAQVGPPCPPRGGWDSARIQARGPAGAQAAALAAPALLAPPRAAARNAPLAAGGAMGCAAAGAPLAGRVHVTPL